MSTTIATTTSHAGALHLRAELRGDDTVLTSAEGHVPYAARIVASRPGWARVVLVQTIAGPLAGDHVTVQVEVGPGAALELVGNAATLALPCAEPARHEVQLRVEAGGRLAWLPEPLILSAGCDLEASLELQLAAGAAAVTRELVVLGRHGKQPGRYRSSVRCELDGAPLLHDAVRLGPEAATDASAAVLDGAGAYGSLALLGLRPARADPDELRLAGDGVALRALAPEAASLRARLDAPEAAWLRELRGGDRTGESA